MILKIIEKIFAVFLICVISYYSINLYRKISKTNEPPPKGKPYIPFQSSSKKICSQEKVKCDPNDLSTCENICADPQKMRCVNMNGENVCLPKVPDIRCERKNGGRYIWTGYGFSQTQDWACLCTKPEIYGGPHCDILNPSYCSRGTINSDLENKTLADICTCPEGSGLLYRTNNIPMCVSKNKNDGGGEEGLYGNFYDMPDWRNVYYQITTKEEWAKNIAREFNYSDHKAIEDILKDPANAPTTPAPTTPTPTPSSSATSSPTTPTPTVVPLVYMLNQKIVDKITSLAGFDTKKKTFDPNYRAVVPYRYFINTYMA